MDTRHTVAMCDAFFAGRNAEWMAFEALKEALLARFPDTQLRVMKTCIAFDDPKPYCYVSLPPRKRMKGILVTFGITAPEENPRFFQVVPISGSRFTVHLSVESAAQVDEELLSFLVRAHDR